MSPRLRYPLMTGDSVFRQMDALMAERGHAERLSVPFIRGHLRGLGCLGSGVTPARVGRGRSAFLRCQPAGNNGPASLLRIQKQAAERTLDRTVTGFLRKVITLYRAQPPSELSSEFRTRLHQSLAQRWIEIHQRRRSQSLEIMISGRH